MHDLPLFTLKENTFDQLKRIFWHFISHICYLLFALSLVFDLRSCILVTFCYCLDSFSTRLRLYCRCWIQRTINTYFLNLRNLLTSCSCLNNLIEIYRSNELNFDTVCNLMCVSCQNVLILNLSFGLLSSSGEHTEFDRCSKGFSETRAHKFFIIFGKI